MKNILIVGTSGSINDEVIADGEDATPAIQSFSAWADIATPRPMPPPFYQVIRAYEQLGPPVVGGMLFDSTQVTSS